MLAPRATKNPLKMHSKFSSLLRPIFHRFFIDFGRVLGGFWAPCWPPRGIENWLAILLGFFFVFLSIFTDFWSPETLILTNSPREILVFENSLYHRFFRFLSIWEAMLASKTQSKSIKNRSKIYQKNSLTYHTFFYRFFTDFGRILGSKLRLCWDYVGQKTLSKTTSKKAQKNTYKNGE